MLNELEKYDYNKPNSCKECGHRKLKYNGVGEYQCEQCGHLMYDDYGTVRNYIEKNPGATQLEVSSATGISKNIIRRLLKDDRIQIASNSMVFMLYERCGAEIRSGRFCNNCLKSFSETAKVKEAGPKSHIVGGFAKKDNESSGAKRFNKFR